MRALSSWPGPSQPVGRPLQSNTSKKTMKNKHACRVIVKKKRDGLPVAGGTSLKSFLMCKIEIFPFPIFTDRSGNKHVKHYIYDRYGCSPPPHQRAGSWPGGEEYIVKGCHYSQEVFTGGLRPPRCDTSRYIIVRFIRCALRSLAGFFSRALSATPSVLRFALRGKG